MTWGVMNPIIMIPAKQTSFVKTRLALAHELFHVRRKDWLWMQLSKLTCCFFWFNPLLWYSRKQTLEHFEQACDESVINTGVLPSDYAGALMYFHQSKPQYHTTAMAAQSQLYKRLTKILTNSRRNDMKLRQTTLFVLTLNLLFITIGCSRVTAATKNENDSELTIVKAPLPNKPVAPVKPLDEEGKPSAPDFSKTPKAPSIHEGIISKEELEILTEEQLLGAEKALIAAEQQLKNFKMPDLKQIEKQLVKSIDQLDVEKLGVLESLELQLLELKEVKEFEKLSKEEREEISKELELVKKQAVKDMEKAKLEIVEAKKQIAMELKNIDMGAIEKQLKQEREEILRAREQIQKQREEFRKQ